MSQPNSPALANGLPPAPSIGNQEVARLRDLTPQQWKSGAAAWLGWMFDGLDMHLFTLIAAPFVALLMDTYENNPSVGLHVSWIHASFLFGWAIGGGFFGRIGDRLGRSRALVLTILTYALFTGLSALATEWWHLCIFRFLAALGIGGEWAVGSSLLSETWPRRWRPWLAAVLQTGVNIGVLMAVAASILMANVPYRYVFLVGILPALLVLWIRRAVPETEEWRQAQKQSAHQTPSVLELFRGKVRRTTILTLLVCSLSLTPHWAFTFWSLQQTRYLLGQENAQIEAAHAANQRLEEQPWTEAGKREVVGWVFGLLMAFSILGNFTGAWFASRIGFRRAIALLCFGYFASMFVTYIVARDHDSLWFFLPMMGMCQGVFALFTMYLPPLFPTLLRTTGAGFCYNIGRIASGFGTVFSGMLSQNGDYRLALICASFVFIPAGVISLFLPEPPDEPRGLAPEHTIPREIPEPSPGPID
jgi:MFS family permease